MDCSFKRWGVCLHTEGELGQVDEALAAAVRSVVRQRLDHEVSLQPGLLHALHHQLHRLQTRLRVEVAVDAHDVSSWAGRHVDFHQQSNDQVEFWRIFVWQFVFRCILNLQPRALWASVLRFFESTPFFPPLDFLFRTVPKPPVGHYGLCLRLFPLLVFNHHADLQLTFIFHIEFIVCWINATPSVKTLFSLQCKDVFLVVFPLSGAKVTCLTLRRSNLHSSFSPLRCLSWFRFCSGCLCWLENI